MSFLMRSVSAHTCTNSNGLGLFGGSEEDTILVQGKAEALYLVRAGVQNIYRRSLSMLLTHRHRLAFCPLCISPGSISGVGWH